MNQTPTRLEADIGNEKTDSEFNPGAGGEGK